MPCCYAWITIIHQTQIRTILSLVTLHSINMFLSRASNEAKWVFTCTSKTHGFSHQYDICKNKKLLKNGTKAIAMSIHIITIIACSSKKSFAVLCSAEVTIAHLGILENCRRESSSTRKCVVDDPNCMIHSFWLWEYTRIRILCSEFLAICCSSNNPLQMNFGGKCRSHHRTLNRFLKSLE
jgi:hypothetical protein